MQRSEHSNRTVCLYGSLFMPESVCLCVSSNTHGSGGGWCGGAGEGHHLLDGQAQLEAVQGVADADLPLDLRV